MDKHRKALELAGHAGCILLKNGAEIFRVQETMTRILCAYGVTDNNVYVISNGIFATDARDATAPFVSRPCIGFAPGAKATPFFLPSGVAPVFLP